MKYKIVITHSIVFETADTEYDSAVRLARQFMDVDGLPDVTYTSVEISPQREVKDVQ